MGVGVTYTLKDFQDYISRMGPRLRSAVVKGVHSGIAHAVPILQEATRKAPPASENGKRGAVNTGGYLGRWRYSTNPGGGRVYNNHPAASVIERGRKVRGKMPPLREIELWARRRLGLTQKEAKSAAFPIAREIARRGLDPRHVLFGARKKIFRAVMKDVRTEVAEARKRGWR